MDTLSKLDFLAVGKNGGYAGSGQYQSNSDHVSNIINHLKDSEINQLTLYFHGGLVDEGSAEASLKRILSTIRIQQKAHDHTMGFIWKTGFVETVRDNILGIFQTKFGASLLKWAIKTVTKKLLLESVKSPGSVGLTIEDIENEWKLAQQHGTVPFVNYNRVVAQGAKGVTFSVVDEDDPILIAEVQGDMETFFMQNPEAEDWGEIPDIVSVDSSLDELAEDLGGGRKGVVSTYKLAKAIVKITARVIVRYLKNSDHGLQATTVEEICRAYFIADIGQWVWASMKDKAAAMWEQEGRIGFDFLDQISKELPDLRINLIGHSAGSICISELLNKKRSQGWRFTVNKVLWLAPACTCRLFEAAIISNPKGYNDFRMITMSDENELQDSLVNAATWLYPSSLLYFISGVLEAEADFPIAGMARYHSAEPPYDEPMFASIKQFLSQKGRLVLSKTGPDAAVGYKSHAIDHSTFNTDSLTLESMAEYIS